MLRDPYEKTENMKMVLRLTGIVLCGVAVIACMAAIGATFAQLTGLVTRFPLF